MKLQRYCRGGNDRIWQIMVDGEKLNSETRFCVCVRT